MISTASVVGFVRLAMSSLLVRVAGRIRLKPFLPLNCAINLLRRDDPLFHNPVRDHSCDRSVEEIQDPMMNSAKTDPEFVDAVTQEVRFRPAQLVLYLAQPLQPEVTLCPVSSAPI